MLIFLLEIKANPLQIALCIHQKKSVGSEKDLEEQSKIITAYINEHTSFTQNLEPLQKQGLISHDDKFLFSQYAEWIKGLERLKNSIKSFLTFESPTDEMQKFNAEVHSWTDRCETKMHERNAAFEKYKQSL